MKKPTAKEIAAGKYLKWAIKDIVESANSKLYEQMRDLDQEKVLLALEFLRKEEEISRQKAIPQSSPLHALVMDIYLGQAAGAICAAVQMIEECAES